MLITTFAFEHIVVWKDNRNIYIYGVNIVRKDFQHSKRESILVEHRSQSIGIESIFSYRHSRILQDRRVRLSVYIKFYLISNRSKQPRLFVKRTNQAPNQVLIQEPSQVATRD